MTAGNSTALYDWHVAHGARMVEFGGWDMPVQYAGIVEEHQAVRTAAGMFDIAHMGRLWLEGPEALDLIQHVWTNDAATMKNGQVRYGLICNEKGGILDDVLVYRWPKALGMVVNASNRSKIVNWLVQHREHRRVQVRDLTTETFMAAVQGPRAVQFCQGVTLADVSVLRYYFANQTTFGGKPATISRTGYTGEDGFEIIVGTEQAPKLWESLVNRGAKPCGLGARDTLRLEAAMPLYGHELNEEIDPFQAGLGWAVKADKGDFVGREAMLRRKEDKTLRQRIGLELPGKRLPREGFIVLAQGKQVGRVTSGTFSPTLQKSIAMAYVEPAFATPGTSLEVDVRGKPEPAVVVKLPFYAKIK